jgi:hypothetical protein
VRGRVVCVPVRVRGGVGEGIVVVFVVARGGMFVVCSIAALC